jgi:hypothetical protein
MTRNCKILLRLVTDRGEENEIAHRPNLSSLFSYGYINPLLPSLVRRGTRPEGWSPGNPPRSQRSRTCGITDMLSVRCFENGRLADCRGDAAHRPRAEGRRGDPRPYNRNDTHFHGFWAPVSPACGRQATGMSDCVRSFLAIKNTPRRSRKQTRLAGAGLALPMGTRRATLTKMYGQASPRRLLMVLMGMPCPYMARKMFAKKGIYKLALRRRNQDLNHRCLVVSVASVRSMVSLSFIPREEIAGLCCKGARRGPESRIPCARQISSLPGSIGPPLRFRAPTRSPPPRHLRRV